MTMNEMMNEERIPPHSEEAEAGALGCMLVDPLRAVTLALNRFRLTGDAFYMPTNRSIFDAISKLAAEGKAIDLLIVSDALRSTGVMDKIGGPVVLDQIVDKISTAAHAEYYFDILRKKKVLRDVIDAGRKTELEAYGSEDGDAVLARARERLAGVVELPAEAESNEQVMSASIQKWQDAADGIRPAIGLETPFGQLTELLCGLEPGITILAGRPSAGKTTMEDILCCHAARQGVAVARATMDSARNELLERAICRTAGVSMPKLKFGFAFKRHDQKTNVLRAKEEIAKYPMWINDSDNDIATISAWFRSMKIKRNVGLFTLDYLQLVMASEMGSSGWDITRRATMISQRMKALAKTELKTPTLVLSQLNRAVEKEGRDPQMSDLRDSGAIEQDAQKIIFLHIDAEKRDEMERNDPGSTKHLRPVWVNVMKHQNGETGKIPFWLHPAYFRFEIDQSGQFSTPELPESRAEDDRNMAQRPMWMPKTEGISHTEEKQERLEMAMGERKISKKEFFMGQMAGRAGNGTHGTDGTDDENER